MTTVSPLSPGWALPGIPQPPLPTPPATHPHARSWARRNNSATSTEPRCRHRLVRCAFTLVPSRATCPSFTNPARAHASTCTDNAARLSLRKSEIVPVPGTRCPRGDAGREDASPAIAVEQHLDRVNGVGYEVGQMILQPLLQRRRQQQLLVRIVGEICPCPVEDLVLT